MRSMRYDMLPDRPDPPETPEPAMVVPSADVPSLGGTEADHLRLLLEQGGIGAWELDTRSGAAWRNLRHDQIFGYDALLPEWTYEQFLGHVLPIDRDAVDRLYSTAIERGKPWSFECRINRADGEQRWISATGRPICDADGTARRLIGHVIDITHTKRNEERLRRVLNELNHRVRNTLTIIQSIAALSFPDHVSVAEGRKEFSGRVQALARTHALLTDESSKGAKIGDLLENALAPYAGGPDARRFSAEGPEILLAAKAAVSLAMTLNELATNAVKHGALSEPGGAVDVRWRRLPDGEFELCELTWIERGGPPVAPPTLKGFGTELIGSLLPSELSGEVDLRFDPSGLRCRATFRVRQQEDVEY